MGDIQDDERRDARSRRLSGGQHDTVTKSSSRFVPQNTQEPYMLMASSVEQN